MKINRSPSIEVWRQAKQLYIAKRFLTVNHQGYKTCFSTVEFTEIVSVDSGLCTRISSGLDFQILTDTSQIAFKISEYPLEKNEQYIFIRKIDEDYNEEVVDNFEYCGIDIRDMFNSNSWITNYGVPYDLKPENYTQYGLLRDISSIKLWLSKRDSDDFIELLENNFSLWAVWRKI